MSSEVMLTSAILAAGYVLITAPYYLPLPFAVWVGAACLAYIAYKALKLAAQAVISLISMFANALIETTKFVLYALAVGLVYSGAFLMNVVGSVFQMAKTGLNWMTGGNSSSYHVEPSAPPYVHEGYGSQMGVVSYPAPSAPSKEDVYQHSQKDLPTATPVDNRYDPRFLSRPPVFAEAVVISSESYSNQL